MKYIALAAILIFPFSLFAQKDTVQSKVYPWNKLKVTKKASGEGRPIAEGSGKALSYMEWHATTIEAGKAPHPPHKHDDEELIIIKEGQLRVTIKDSSKLLGPGSIAVFMPGDKHGLLNTGNTKASYYVLRYRSKAPVDMKRAKAAGGSFVMDWKDVLFQPHEKGGIRRFVERPTAMLNRFEMHVTTLKAGLKSHDPHTHSAEEIILLIDGDTEEQIGEHTYKAITGDLIYLSSGILHAIQNKGSKQAMYFAFQWQ